MKIRELLQKISGTVRPVQVPRKAGEADNVDALSGVEAERGHVAFPPNYVPSQQDERPL